MTAPWIVAFVMLALLVFGMALVMLGLLRRITSVLERAELEIAGLPRGGLEVGGAPAGTTLEGFELADETGRIRGAAELFAEPTIFLFMSEGCYPCRELGRRLKGVDERIDGARLLVVTAEGDTKTRIRVPNELPVFYQRRGAASAAFGTTAAPHAFYLDAGGIVLGATVPGSAEDLRRLVEAHARGGDRQPTEAALP